MIAAGASGSGKTTVTCGLLQALVNRGLRTASFKCGPDYIDPMFHSRIIGVPSRNLDPFFCDAETICFLLARDAEQFQISVMEGVMGYYDGLAGTSLQASSYDLARITETPVVLVVNTRGMSRSVVPVIQGLLRYQEDSRIVGVILNQMSAGLYPEIRALVERECGIPVLGYVPRSPELVIGSRHLGLVTPDGVADLQAKLQKMAEILEEAVDVDGLLRMAESAPQLSFTPPQLSRLPEGQTVRLGLARDEAFCFCYEDNLDLLRRMGAELVPFSPLRDESLPEGVQGLLLPGGYPELCADRLEENGSMRSSIRRALEEGLPCLAECGGFMYLHREMEDMEGHVHAGVGLLPGRAYRTEKLGRFGYVTLTAHTSQLLGEAGMQIRGHEFHYFDSTYCGDAFHAQKPLRKRGWECIHANETAVLGFPHLYYYSNPEAIWHFVKICAGESGNNSV
ncbi:MAG: cobyrinate a,c-diamide synthase [Lachnospiraceae bacterium]|nr:cobyrinate a,c-diamide synthase [Lachnospiraceae bacterium]